MIQTSFKILIFLRLFIFRIGIIASIQQAMNSVNNQLNDLERDKGKFLESNFDIILIQIQIFLRLPPLKLGNIGV